MSDESEKNELEKERGRIVEVVDKLVFATATFAITLSVTLVSIAKAEISQEASQLLKTSWYLFFAVIVIHIISYFLTERSLARQISLLEDTVSTEKVGEDNPSESDEEDSDEDTWVERMDTASFYLDYLAIALVLVGLFYLLRFGNLFL